MHTYKIKKIETSQSIWNLRSMPIRSLMMEIILLPTWINRQTTDKRGRGITANEIRIEKRKDWHEIVNTFMVDELLSRQQTIKVTDKI